MAVEGEVGDVLTLLAFPLAAHHPWCKICDNCNRDMDESLLKASFIVILVHYSCM